MAKNLINDETFEFVEGIEKSDHDALAERVTTVEGKVTTLEGKVRNITISTADPSGGSDGDIWIKIISG